MAAAGFMNDPSNGDTRQTLSDVTTILARAAEGEAAGEAKPETKPVAAETVAES